MRLIYTSLFYLCTPIIILRLLWKSRRLPAYRDRILERFFLQSKKPTPVDVWVHAVSLGEVNAAVELVNKLIFLNQSVMFTTMTPTGSERVQSLFKDKVQHQYIPYDMPWMIRQFYRSIQPKLGIIMETELWPNCINEAYKQGFPLFIVNGRISDGAFKQYLKCRKVFRPILNQLAGIIAQSKLDAERFIQLGIDAAKVTVAGNLKFDLKVTTFDGRQFDLLQQAWGQSRPVVLAASTHENEEEQLLDRLKILKGSIPDVLLLIAPRHPERFNTVYKRAKEKGFNTGLRSNSSSISDKCDVIVLDSMGELSGFFAYTDYAFVGGSLVPIGGHNVLEPMMLGVAVYTGPFNHNSKAIIEALSQAKAITIASDADELIQSIITHFQQPEVCQKQIARANQVLTDNRGSIDNHMKVLKPHLIL
jgi:3-deoxy-D-manno-octulosonic-acid transferase